MLYRSSTRTGVYLHSAAPLDEWWFPVRAFLFGAVALMLSVACSAGAQQERGLTRPDAKAVITRDGRFATTARLDIVAPHRESANAGRREGLWIDQGCLSGLSLTQEGRRYFTQAQGNCVGGYSLTLVQPARREIVDITGIADSLVGRNM